MKAILAALVALVMLAAPVMAVTGTSYQISIVNNGVATYMKDVWTEATDLHKIITNTGTMNYGESANMPGDGSLLDIETLTSTGSSALSKTINLYGKNWDSWALSVNESFDNTAPCNEEKCLTTTITEGYAATNLGINEYINAGAFDSWKLNTFTVYSGTDLLANTGIHAWTVFPPEELPGAGPSTHVNYMDYAQDGNGNMAQQLLSADAAGKYFDANNGGLVFSNMRFLVGSSNGYECTGINMPCGLP